MENEEEMIECEWCHNQVEKSKTKTAYFHRENVSGYFAGEVCEECIRQFFTECEDCGNLYETETMTQTDDGLVCEVCLEEDYAPCYYCNTYHRVDNMTWADESYVCDECFDEHYIYCHDCGEIEHRDNAYWVESLNDYICDSCYVNNYTICENCGEIIHIDYAYTDEYSGCYYCESCWEEREEMDDEEILRYHGNGGDWTPYKTAEDRENPIYFGFELEIEHKDYSRKNQHEAVRVLKDNMNCYLEHDGSLNDGGFEIVSQPQTYKYLMQNYENYKNVFGKLIDLGYISHNSSHCGLHFHVTAPSEKREDIVSRLWLIIENYKEQFEKISRRKGDFHWCHFLSENNPKSSLSGMYKMKGVQKDGTRYLVINNQNSKTIEIRLFRGTLNVDTFFADLQLVNNLFTLAYDLNTKIEDITWAKLIKGQYIAKHCQENKIFSRRKIKDDSEKYISLENRVDKSAQNVYNEFYKVVLKFNKEVLAKNIATKTINVDYIRQYRDITSHFNSLITTLYDMGNKINNKKYKYFLDTVNDFKYYARQLNIQIEDENVENSNLQKFKKYYNKLMA